MGENNEKEQIHITSRDGERVDPTTVQTEADFICFLKHLKAYEFLRQYSKDLRALEVGCGTGYGTHYLSDHFIDVTAADVNADLIGSLISSNSHSNVKFICYDGRRLPFDLKSFDLVFSFQVIEHVLDDLNFLKEIDRVLAPGGIAVISTPNRLYRLKEGQTPFNLFHVREYSPQDFTQLLKKIFPDFKIFGLRGKDQVQQIELARVRSGLARYDIFNLRKYLPSHLVGTISLFIKKFVNKKTNTSTDFRQKYSLGDFYIEESKLETSLDLISVCRK